MNSLYNIRANLKLIILLLAVIVFIGKLLPMVANFDVNPKSISLSHKKADEFLYSTFSSNSSSGEIDSNRTVTIEIALVVCGDKERARKALPLIKSAIIYSHSLLNIHLFTDSEPRKELQNIYSNFSEKITNRVKFVYHDTWFPSDGHTFWEKLYGKCATQRLFFPSLLKNLTSVMYFDTDMIVVSRLEKIWNKFADFNEREIFAGAVDCGVKNCMYATTRPWRLVPHIWEHGVNSGMLLMRLDRMREFDFEAKIMKTAINPKFSWRIHGDEDIINALFHNKSEIVHRLDCTYNYFPNVYCVNRTECDISNGIKVIHGVGSQFENFPQQFYSLLSQSLINIDINRNGNLVLNELLEGLVYKQLYNDPCYFTKLFIFQEQAEEE